MIFAQARGAVSGRAQPLSYAAVLGLGYLLFYGWLLARSGGLPYVFDNNESFSTLWHAINLHRFGFGSGHGLSDEAYGASPAAHPYVYTHQGNFPRLVAFIFYTLGARTVEAQIVVTTFTVGVAALFLAYRFLGQLTGSWGFALLACAVLFSDYVLVAQWQMVTYRAWHGFFFFATLSCVHGIGGLRPRRAGLALLACTACLFYFELVFAAFVAACAGLYALFRNPGRPGRVALAGAALAAGCAIGVGVLCAQIALQVGWDNFLKDAGYTFVSRNQFPDGSAMVSTLREFYESNHIVFWFNLFDASGFRTPWHLGASIIYYELQPHTPYFVLLLLIPAMGWLAGRDRVQAAAAAVRWGGFEAFAFAVTTLVLAVMLSGSPQVLGWAPRGAWLRGIDILLGGLATILACIAIARLSGTREPGWRGWIVPGPAGRAAMGRGWLFNLIVIGILVAQPLLFNQKYQPVWQALGQEVLVEPVLRMLMLLSVAFAHALLHARGRVVPAGGPLLPGVGPFLLAGYLAYVVVYLLTPGYVFTGYRFRLAPLTVFLTDVVVAWGLWLVLRGAMAISAGLRLHPAAGIAAGSIPLLFWAQLQFAQVSLMPPDQFAILKTLANPPYRGASFVSNAYAAPVAAFTGQWAYIDTELAEATVVIRDGRRRLKTDHSYVWFADRASNPAYAEPQYFLCRVPQSLPSLAAKSRRDRGEGRGYQGCAEMGLVRFAMGRQDGVIPRAELVAIDTEGPARFGHATWALVKLDWRP